MNENLSQIFRRSLLRKSPQFSVEVNTNRLEAFSDGVFAIAITLLILQVRIPLPQELQQQSLRSYLLKLWPNIFSYVFSFLILGVYWANHHHIFRLYKRTDHFFNLLNVLFLMTISFLPFPSAILGDYIAAPQHVATAVTFFSIGIFLPALMWFLIWIYASHRHRLVDEHLSPAFIRYQYRVYIGSILIYLVAILVSFKSAKISLGISVLLTILYLLPARTPDFIMLEQKASPKANKKGK